MDSDLYSAAVTGDIKYFQEITGQKLDHIVTPYKNTILHLNIAFDCHPSSTFVEQVLENCPALLLQVNENGDTPLHLAARQERVAIVDALIKHAKANDQRGDHLESGETAVKQMLRKTNKEGNTSLHEAAKTHSVDVVKMLTKEDPDVPYPVNKCGETPLYIAASTSCLEVVREILETCKSATHEGPCGMTTLHAAAKRNHLDITRKILEKKNLAKAIDQNGWTPLHHAAYYGHHLIVQSLVEFDASTARMVDKCREMTALHLAAGQGHFDIVKTILSTCPDCVELVDNKGWSFVHFAMVSFRRLELNKFVEGWGTKYFINAKDKRGNTPLLVLASIRRTTFYHIEKNVRREFIESTMESIQNQEEQFHQLKNEISALSKLRDGPYKLGVIRLRDIDSDDPVVSWTSEIEKRREIYLIVTALIATVTFTAGLTLPGGYIQDGLNQGTAVLIRDSTFQAFVVSDATALVLSVSAVFLHFLLQIRQFNHYIFLFQYAHFFTLNAIIAMMVAFATGTFAILRPSSELAITTAIVGLSFFLIVFYVSWKLLLAIMRGE